VELNPAARADTEPSLLSWALFTLLLLGLGEMLQNEMEVSSSRRICQLAPDARNKDGQLGTENWKKAPPETAARDIHCPGLHETGLKQFAS
jgi:hypothetical protein